MSYLRAEPTADYEFEESSENDELDASGLEQFRLSNIKDRPPILDVDALHEVLEDFAWDEPAQWTQTQVVTTASIPVDDVNDDMQRELAFYKQAEAGAEDAIRRFESAGVSWLRPPDYYAESVKSDAHMAKVKEQLMYEQRMIEEAEQRRKNREMKQYAKQVQAEKQKARIQEKKDQIESITKLRKQRSNAGFQGDLEFDKDMKVKGQRLTPDKAGQRIRADGKKPSKHRQARDAKFGFGGRKKLGKQNTAASTADMNASFGRKGKPGTRGKNVPRGKAGVQKRPGKRARDAKRK